MPDLLAPAAVAVAAPANRAAIGPPSGIRLGATVLGIDGRRLGMVSALIPDPGAATHLLVFVAERQQLIPREYPLPLASVVRVDEIGAVHVAVTGDALRRVAGEEARRRAVEE